MAATNGALAIDVYLDGGMPPAGVADRFNVDSTNPSLEATRLSELFASMASGVRPGKVRVRTDSVTGVRASITLAVTQANIAVGEYIDIVIPGRGGFRILAVASGPDVTLGQFVSETSNAVTATNMAAAIDGMLGLKSIVDASTNSGDLIITARDYGTLGNSYIVVDGTVNGISGEGNFSGGKDASTAVTATIGCVLANTDADDTVAIGSVTFIAKASGASGNEQFNLGASDAAMGDNLVAKINAHPDLLGLVSGINASGTITLTYAVAPRIAQHIRLATSDADGLVITQPSLASVAITNTTATRTYALGGA